MSDTQKDWRDRFIVPIVVGILTAVPGGSLAAYVTMKVMEQRLTQVEEKVVKLEEKAIDRSERLIRIETKMDIIILQKTTKD